MNIPNIRLLNQQLVAPQFSEVHDMVSWMGMLQAQEYRMMRWAVGTRLKRPSMKAVEAAYDAGKIIRTHLFRCTWQLVAAEDLRWMLQLCADKNRSTINGYAAYYGRTISEKEYDHANNLIHQVLTGHTSMTKKELLSHLAEYGFTEDTRLISIFLRRAEADGVICSGKLDRRENTYSLVDERVPGSSDLTRKEAVIRLAQKYFRGHSPATLEDFVWWSNLNIGECRIAMNTIRGELLEERYEGSTYYIHQDCRIRGGCPRTILLPPYDEYLIGYKSRQHVIEEEYRDKAYSRNGIFYPVIVHDGKIIGNWHPSKEATFFKEEYKVDIGDAIAKHRAFLSESSRRNSLWDITLFYDE